MQFGEGYYPVESNQLKEGVYKARIIGVGPKVKDGYEWMEVQLDISRHPGCQPNKIIMNYQPTQAPSYGGTLADAMTSWNKKMTIFFDSFGIQRGNFQTQTWIGKIGYVECKKQKNKDFMQLQAVKVAEEEGTPAPPSRTTPEQSVALFAQQVGGSVQSGSAQNGFTDDIQF